MARKPGVNDPNKSKLIRPELLEINLHDLKIINPVTEKTNLNSVAKSLGYKPENLELSSPKEKAAVIKNDLSSAKSFGELDGKLSKSNLWLEKKNEQIVFTDGYSNVRASSIDPDFKIENFQRKFGEDASKYLKFRNDGIDIKGAENKVQKFFDHQLISELKETRQEIKTQIANTRYELASIQTSPKQSRNISRKESLLAQKTNLMKKHQNLSTEIASLQKKSGINKGIDLMKSQVNYVKSTAGQLGESVKKAKKGFAINRDSAKGIQSAREIIGLQKAFTSKIKEGVKLPSRFSSLSTAAKPVMKVSYAAYQKLSRIASDPEMTR